MAVDQAAPQRQTMNIESFAKVLGISRARAYQLARNDELHVPVIRIGNRRVVSVRAVEALLDRTRDERPTAALRKPRRGQTSEALWTGMTT